MTRILSQKIRFLTFISIILLGYVHGYNMSNTYLTPLSVVEETLTFTGFFEYLFANGLLRFRIPLLFLISGYLYAYTNNKPWKERVAKRFGTLIVPYLCWSAFGLGITFLLQQFEYTAHIVKAAELDQLGDNRPYAEIGIYGIIVRWLWVPISFQLWFIFVLFVYNLSFPVINWLLDKAAPIWLGITGVLWFTLFYGGFIEGQGLFFFSLGAYLQKRNFNIQQEPKWFSLGLAWIFFIGLCIIKTFMAFELNPLDKATPFLIGILYQLAIPTGVLAVWFSTDRLANWWTQQPLLKSWLGHSFFVYGLHIPLMAYFMRWILIVGADFPYIRITTYIVLPLLFMVGALQLADFAKKHAPALYKLLSGGRGL